MLTALTVNMNYEFFVNCRSTSQDYTVFDTEYLILKSFTEIIYFFKRFLTHNIFYF